jgi:hypothetical protein
MTAPELDPLVRYLTAAIALALVAATRRTELSPNINFGRMPV